MKDTKRRAKLILSTETVRVLSSPRSERLDSKEPMSAQNVCTMSTCGQ